jgi:hypothetical protein
MPSGFSIIITAEQTKELIDDYLSGASSRQLALKYGFKCQKSITKILRNNQIDVRSKEQENKSKTIIFNQQDIDQIRQLNNNPQTSLLDIARIFNVDPKIIKRELNKLGEYNPRKYDEYLINKFDIIDTEEKAYWLGFLAADATIGYGQLQLRLAEKDLDHLLKFKNFIGVNYNITRCESDLNEDNNDDSNYEGKIFVGYQYAVSSKKFVASLARHGLVRKKSLILQFPTTIKSELIHHYIRGLIDGDGSFYIDKYDRLYFSLVSSLEICEKVQQYLMNNCNLFKTKLYKKQTKNKKEYYYYLIYCGSVQVCRIASYLYNNANIYLDRKKQLIDNFKSTHKFRTIKSH